MFKIKFKVEEGYGSFNLASEGCMALIACHDIAKEHIHTRLFKRLLAKGGEVELTISLKPIDHTFVARLIGGTSRDYTFCYDDKDGEQVWEQHHEDIHEWINKNKLSGKKAYFFFEIL